MRVVFQGFRSIMAMAMNMATIIARLALAPMMVTDIVTMTLMVTVARCAAGVQQGIGRGRRDQDPVANLYRRTAFQAI